MKAAFTEPPDSAVPQPGDIYLVRIDAEIQQGRQSDPFAKIRHRKCHRRRGFLKKI
jgi:hypothetical protein